MTNEHAQPMNPPMRYVPADDPVTEVYEGMTGSSMCSTFVVKGWKNGRILVDQTDTIGVGGTPRTYSTMMSTEDVLRLCDRNKGHWVRG